MKSLNFFKPCLLFSQRYHLWFSLFPIFRHQRRVLGPRKALCFSQFLHFMYFIPWNNKKFRITEWQGPRTPSVCRTNHLSIEGDRQGLWLSTHITDGHLVCNQNHIQAVFFTASFYFLSDLADHPPLPLPPLKMWQNYFMVFYSQLFKRVPVLSCLGAQGRTTPPSPPPLKCDKTLYTGL